MLLVLAVPGLLEAHASGDTFDRTGSLAQLLAAAGKPRRDAGDASEALAARYGIERQTDWPLAAVRLAALGVDPGGAYWLAADPVTLSVGRDEVRLAGIVDDLELADAVQLVATLNAHFRSDGLAFVAPRPDALFVRADPPPRLLTHALSATAGRPLRELLPEGPDAATWRRWQSEIQMLLHAHPVNVARERTGRPPANSLWFSGGGVMPAHPLQGRSIRTYANSGIAVALAAHARAPARALPERLDVVLDAADPAETIVVALERGHDAAALETAWMAPAWHALSRGRLRVVAIISDGAGRSVTWEARRPGPGQRLAARFWRRHDLHALLESAKDG